MVGELWFSFEVGVGHSGGLYVSLDGAQQLALREDAHRRLGSPEDPFTLAARARTVVRGIRQAP